jgi:hypothetical protein
MAAIGRELGLAQTLSISRLVTKLQEIHGVEEKSEFEAIAESVTDDIALNEAPTTETQIEQTPDDEILAIESPSIANS